MKRPAREVRERETRSPAREGARAPQNSDRHRKRNRLDSDFRFLISDF